MYNLTVDDAGKPVINNAGQPVMQEVGRYGLHALRHACASLWIEQGQNPKQIQTLMRHSSIKVTFDTYGHLFADRKPISGRLKASNCALWHRNSASTARNF